MTYADNMPLEERVSNLEDQVAAMETNVRRNTVVIEAIKRDTEEVIGLLRGGKLFGRLIAWLATVAAGLGVIWAMVKGWNV